MDCCTMSKIGRQVEAGMDGLSGPRKSLEVSRAKETLRSFHEKEPRAPGGGELPCAESHCFRLFSEFWFCFQGPFSFSFFLFGFLF